jgi:hypothetical protein
VFLRSSFPFSFRFSLLFLFFFLFLSCQRCRHLPPPPPPPLPPPLLVPSAMKFSMTHLDVRVCCGGHTLCSVCVTKLIQDAKISCPLDRKVTNTGSCDAVMKNYTVLDALSSSKSVSSSQSESRPSLCTLCEDADPHPITHYCVECEEYLCQTLATGHKRMKKLSNHQLVSTSEKPVGLKKSAVRPLCGDHKRSYDLFDKTCQVLVCTECIAKKHNKHEFQALLDAERDCRERIGCLAKEVNVMTQQMKKVAESVKKTLEELKECFSQQDTAITTTFANVLFSLSLSLSFFLSLSLSFNLLPSLSF